MSDSGCLKQTDFVVDDSTWCLFAEKNRLKEKLEEAAADEHTPPATPSVTNKPDLQQQYLHGNWYEFAWKAFLR